MINVAILTVSDRSYKGEREDTAGPALCEKCKELGWNTAIHEIVPDEEAMIISKLEEWSNIQKADLIITTGGTGFSPRDVTPEATKKVVTRESPGLMEFIRMKSSETNKHAVLSRGMAGISGSTLIINLPGSKAAALESLHLICDVIPHACELIRNSQDSERHHKL